MIETRLLQYFLAVAEEQSITRAANYLHITQPTLSKQMMDLEEQLGKQLFIRGKKKITLTEDGLYLRGRAQEVVSLIEKTEHDFRENEQNISGDIHIGCGEYQSSSAIMKIICDIRRDYPDIHFHFFSSNADTILERLDKGLIDIGILLDPEITPRYDYQKLPLMETWGVLMPKDTPLTKKKKLTLEDLSGIPMIVPSQTSNNKRFGQLFSEHQISLDIVSTYNLIFNASLMVQAGIGYALCIGGLIPPSTEHNLIFRPLNPAIISNVYIFTKKYQVFSKATKLFISRLEQELL
ncbi:MAG: LysR family transcriptional regulator [Lachnospiraceae bacterium]|nr:LysR family transcriptional regulator [Lachnospiraceae bacterium]